MAVIETKYSVGAMTHDKTQSVPVAWMLTKDGCNPHISFYSIEQLGYCLRSGDGWTETPLYARPQDPAAVERAAWQPIETCEAWRTDHLRRVLAYWTTRGVCETYWDEDEDFDDRPKGWVSPREGWRSPGDMCIPINQDAVTHWMPLPPPPASPPASPEANATTSVDGDGAGEGRAS